VDAVDVEDSVNEVFVDVDVFTQLSMPQVE